MSSSPARNRRGQLWRVIGSEPYNSFLRNRYADIKPVDAGPLYIITCGDKGIIKPHTSPTGVIFRDGSYLRIFEKWSVTEDSPLAYSYHYQIPHGTSIRYEKDPKRAATDHPVHHLHISELGKKIRLPTGEVRCEEILQMIFQQFVMPR